MSFEVLLRPGRLDQGPPATSQMLNKHLLTRNRTVAEGAILEGGRGFCARGRGGIWSSSRGVLVKCTEAPSPSPLLASQHVPHLQP